MNSSLLLRQLEVMAKLGLKGMNLEFLGVPFRIAASQAGALEWAARLFQGYVFPSEVRPQLEVLLYAQPHGWRFQAPLDAQLVDLFLGRQGWAWQEGESRLVLDEGRGTCYVFQPGRAWIGVPEAAWENERELLGRLAREMLVWLLRGQGFEVFQAGGVVLEGTGLMVLGPKGSGKTALVVQLLAQKGREIFYLANGRLLVKPGRLAPQAAGYPLAVRLGQALAEQYQAGLAQRGLFAPDFALDPVSRVWKRMLAPQELVDAFGSRIASRADVGLVLVPCLSEAQRPARVELVPPAEREAVLRTCWRPWEPSFPPFFQSEQEGLPRECAAAIWGGLLKRSWFRIVGHYQDSRLADEVSQLARQMRPGQLGGYV